MISLQCTEFNEQIEISFVLLDVFEVFIASLCRFSKYTGYQDWKKWGKKTRSNRESCEIHSGSYCLYPSYTVKTFCVYLIKLYVYCKDVLQYN